MLADEYSSAGKAHDWEEEGNKLMILTACATLGKSSGL